MKKYELMVIIDPDIGTDSINTRLDKIRKLITSHNGEVFYEDIWGIRDLSYKMKNHDTGYYAVMNFNMEGEELEEIETVLKLENEVIRHLIVTLPSAYAPRSFAKIEKDDDNMTSDKKEEKPEAKAQKRDESKAPAKKRVHSTSAQQDEKKASPADRSSEPAKKAEPSLEDVDAKLKSIIDNPDLNF